MKLWTDLFISADMDTAHEWKMVMDGGMSEMSCEKD